LAAVGLSNRLKRGSMTASSDVVVRASALDEHKMPAVRAA
jgi:hypothetical protein